MLCAVDMAGRHNPLLWIASKQFASSVLETRLNEVLRFTLGRTYGVSVQDSFTSAPPMLRPDQPLPGTVTVRIVFANSFSY